MGKILVLFLFFIASDFCYGQHAQQLTNNSYYDGDPDIYKERIAWTAGYYDFPNPRKQAIFLCEKGIIKQITSGDHFDFEPKIGSNYITWLRYLDNNNSTSIEKNEIWCYDGKTNKKISLNSTENHLSRTAGRYIVWTGKNPEGEVKIYFFDGEKTEILPIYKRPESFRSIEYYLCEEGLLLLEDNPTGGRKILFYDFLNFHLIAENKNDTTVGIGRLSGRTILFTKHYPGEPQFKQHFFIYRKGETKAVPELDSISTWGSIIHFDSTNIVWEDRRDFSNYKINVWMDGKHYFLSQYPFNVTQSHPELSKLRFAWHERINNTTQILYFDGKTINNISNNSINNYRPVVSGNSVVWFGQRVPESRHDDVTNSTEIFYYCGSEGNNCQQPTPLDENMQKAYYDYNNQKIVFEAFGGLNENINLALYDLRGREIFNQTFNLQFGINTLSIPVSGLGQSIYILRMNHLTKPDKSFSLKLLITH